MLPVISTIGEISPFRPLHFFASTIGEITPFIGTIASESALQQRSYNATTRSGQPDNSFSGQRAADNYPSPTSIFQLFNLSIFQFFNSTTGKKPNSK